MVKRTACKKCIGSLRDGALEVFVLIPIVLWFLVTRILLYYIWPYRVWKGYMKFKGEATLEAMYNFMINDIPNSDECNERPTKLNVPSTSFCEKGVVGETGFQTLEVTLPMDEILNEFKATGVIRVRDIDRDKLVVACGNVTTNPKHQHADAVTINPHWTYNPTILGYFGQQPLTCIADKSMREIHLEGYRPYGLFMKWLAFKEIKRILADDGVLFIRSAPAVPSHRVTFWTMF